MALHQGMLQKGQVERPPAPSFSTIHPLLLPWVPKGADPQRQQHHLELVRNANPSAPPQTYGLETLRCDPASCGSSSPRDSDAQSSWRLAVLSLSLTPDYWRGQNRNGSSLRLDSRTGPHTVLHHLPTNQPYLSSSASALQGILYAVRNKAMFSFKTPTSRSKGTF